MTLESMSELLLRPAEPLPDDLPPGSGDYEYRVITIPRQMSRSQGQQLLAMHAEQGRWEIARVVHYMGGTRRVWVRRRIIRVVRTA